MAPAPRNKSDQVLAKLRTRILDGDLSSGDRLPTFNEMVKEFGVSRMVLQTAIARLKEDGFIRSVHRHGLYVAERPPHLHRYGLVLGPHGDDGLAWSRINVALLNEARRLSKENEALEFELHIRLHEEETAPQLCAEILAEVDRCRLAGLILGPETHQHLDERLKSPDLGVPVVSLFGPEGLSYPVNVTGDRKMFYRKAIHRLTELGRRRIAVIHMAGTASVVDHAKLFAEAGLPLCEPWIQFVGRSHPEVAERLVTLLFHAAPDQRPDGLLIADDNLIEHVSKGLAAMDIRVGKDVSIVAHTNWPWPYASVLPMDRLGYSATDTLRLAIETCQALQGNQHVRTNQLVPALFERELPPETAGASGVPSRSGSAR